ncbi:MAG: glycosyltransferase family 39 protein [Acidimicrobiia bacterium]|nr:glycosyltransferase family 39 protein [Acidimicrobiia bacterium]
MVASPSRRFKTALLLILIVAAGIRTTFIITVARHDTDSFYDAGYYELQARQLGKGHGYNDPFQFLPGHPHVSTPAADHPPLTVFTILPVIWAGDQIGFAESTTQLIVRFEMLLLGMVGIVLLAMLARRLAGDRAGLIAAAIAATYPHLWINDTLIMSETLAVAAVVGALLLLLRLEDEPKLATAAALGVVCGLGALARAELILLAPLLALPLLWFWRARPWRARIATVVVVGVGVLAIVGPWVAFNQARFEESTFISTNDGIAILGSTCDAVFSGPPIGLTNLSKCVPKRAPKGDQSVVSKIYRQRAFDYINDGHGIQFLKVIAARIGRDWGLFRPADMPSFNESEGRPRWVTTLGMWWYYPLLALAIAGAVVLRRRRVRQWFLAVPPVIVTVGAILSYGQTRFRVPAEPVIVVLAAVALSAVVGVPGRRARRDDPIETPSPVAG